MYEELVEDAGGLAPLENGPGGGFSDVVPGSPLPAGSRSMQRQGMSVVAYPAGQEFHVHGPEPFLSYSTPALLPSDDPAGTFVAPTRFASFYEEPFRAWAPMGHYLLGPPSQDVAKPQPWPAHSRELRHRRGPKAHHKAMAKVRKWFNRAR